VPWRSPGKMVRLQIGLEDPADLIADLARGLAAAAQ
jgi:cystathionine beta-lyase